MALVKRNNGHDLVFPTFSNLVENFLGDIGSTTGMDVKKTVPAVNIIETKDEFRFEIAAPGLSKEHFRINLDNNVLVISADKEKEAESDNKNYSRKEFSYSSFSRAFTLPSSVNVDRITAKYEDGLLKLVVPKRDEIKPRTIEIS